MHSKMHLTLHLLPMVVNYSNQLSQSDNCNVNCTLYTVHNCRLCPCVSWLFYVQE